MDSFPHAKFHVTRSTIHKNRPQLEHEQDVITVIQSSTQTKHSVHTNHILHRYLWSQPMLAHLNTCFIIVHTDLSQPDQSTHTKSSLKELVISVKSHTISASGSTNSDQRSVAGRKFHTSNFEVKSVWQYCVQDTHVCVSRTVNVGTWPF